MSPFLFLFYLPSNFILLSWTYGFLVCFEFLKILICITCCFSFFPLLYPKIPSFNHLENWGSNRLTFNTQDATIWVSNRGHSGSTMYVLFSEIFHENTLQQQLLTRLQLHWRWLPLFLGYHQNWVLVQGLGLSSCLKYICLTN
jgi:hypothetical protein